MKERILSGGEPDTHRGMPPVFLCVFACLRAIPYKAILANGCKEWPGMISIILALAGGEVATSSVQVPPWPAKAGKRFSLVAGATGYVPITRRVICVEPDAASPHRAFLVDE